MVKVSDIEWLEADEPGGAEGFYEAGPHWTDSYEIWVAGRQRTHTAYYSASNPNQRSWTLGVYGGDNIANGEADGLREAKKAALTALNEHLETKRREDASA